MRKSLSFLAAGLSVALTCIAHPSYGRSEHSLQQMLDSNLGDPAYRYKLGACLYFDAELIVRSGAKRKTLFIDQKYFSTMRDEYFRIYGLKNPKTFNAFMYNDNVSLIVEEHFRKKLVQTDAGIAELRKLCKDTMMALVNIDSSKSFDPQGATVESSKISSDKAHDECLEARDYEGCMRHKKGFRPSSDTSFEKDECFDSGWCLAKNSKPDHFGFPKLAGWIYRYRPEKNILEYHDVYRSEEDGKIKRQWYKVKVRGEYGRYISTREIFRRTRPGRPAVPGYSTSSGEGSTDCQGYDDGMGTLSIDCTTKSPAVISTPGIPGRSDKNVSETLHTIIDCQDLTYVKRWVSESSRANAREGKWQKVPAETFNSDDFKQVCSAIERLPESSYRGYE